jgi:hypothetical protein
MVEIEHQPQRRFVDGGDECEALLGFAEGNAGLIDGGVEIFKDEGEAGFRTEIGDVIERVLRLPKSRPQNQDCECVSRGR